MHPVIPPVDKELLKSELTEDKFIRDTNNASNKLYIITAQDSPNIMREIGRLREAAFREAGGGTGQEVDIDELDTAEDGYTQLIVWDPKESEIVGGYRYKISRETHPKNLSTEHYFRFSEKFRNEFLPYTLELGRSFIQPNYQGTRRNPKGIYALDNLWDGIGAIIIRNPDIQYLFGKVTMYGDYNKQARNILIYFLRKYFPDHDNLIEPIYPIELDIDVDEMKKIFTGSDYTENYKILIREIRNHQENIPPLFNSYMSISPSMRVFGTVKNPDFGDVEETGILITKSDLYVEKIERHFKELTAKNK